MKKLLLITVLLSLSHISMAASEVIVFNGGISQEERATAPAGGTRLVFFVRSGSFLSNVTVNVKNAAGAEVVNTVTRGPWLILNLPDGRYHVVASIPSGEAQGLDIDVMGNREFGFMFTSVE